MTDSSLLTGFAVGFSIAVPVGPMGLLCIRRTLASGMRIGLCTGLGAATVNVFYGLLVILGSGSLAPVLASSGRILGLVGGVFLLWSALRTVMRRRERSFPGSSLPARLSPGAAYGSAVVFNVTNPMSPMLVLALLSPILGTGAPSCNAAASILSGMFLAASCWWVCLTWGVSLLRTRLTATTLVVLDRVAAAMLAAYGTLAISKCLMH